MSKKQAIVRIAKKLLHRIRFVCKHQTCYVMQAGGEEEKAQQRGKKKSWNEPHIIVTDVQNQIHSHPA